MPTKGTVLQNTLGLMDIINIKQPIKICNVPSLKKFGMVLILNKKFNVPIHRTILNSFGLSDGVNV